MNPSTTFERFAEEKKAAANEQGTEAPCPWCGKARLRRSDYIRCNGCGVNWLDGEDLSKDPRADRKAAAYRNMKMQAVEEV
jgi:ribosomal protein L37AE/L43A